MKFRFFAVMLVVLAASVGLGAGVAIAAASPTVQNLPATKVTKASATLNATINPNGSATTYRFQYGPTPALGSLTAIKNAGSGTRTASVSAAITGLQSGTTYYYDVVASSAGGIVTSKTLTFKTLGPPPAQAQTGGATVLSSSSATLTGVVSPGGAPTQYYFEIGSTAGSYTLHTPTQTTAASTTPVAVSYTVTGLAPGTVFHYALVATRTASDTSTGADASFETFPNPVPRPTVTARTSPRLERGGPYLFTTSGRVINRSSTPDALACNGTVATVIFTYGRRIVHRVLAPLTPSCTYSAQTTFRHYPLRHRGPERLRVVVRFDGGGYLAVALSPTRTVTLG